MTAREGIEIKLIYNKLQKIIYKIDFFLNYYFKILKNF